MKAGGAFTSHWTFPLHPDEPQSGTENARPGWKQATMIPNHLTGKQSLTCGDGAGYRLTIVIVYSCLREFIVLSSNTTIPPPSTVSIVLAKRLGVTASKSCVTQKTKAQTYCLQRQFPTFFGVGPNTDRRDHRSFSPARRTCRRCFPGSCVSRCSNSSGCW